MQFKPKQSYFRDILMKKHTILALDIPSSPQGAKKLQRLPTKRFETTPTYQHGKSLSYYEGLRQQVHQLQVRTVTKFEPDLQDLGETYKTSYKEVRSKKRQLTLAASRANISQDQKSQRMYDITVKHTKVKRNGLQRKPQTYRTQSEESDLYGKQNRKIRETHLIFIEVGFLRKYRLRRLFKRLVYGVMSLNALMDILPDHIRKRINEKRKVSLLKDRAKKIMPLLRLKPMSPTKSRIVVRQQMQEKKHKQTFYLGLRLNEYIDNKLAGSPTNSDSPARGWGRKELPKIDMTSSSKNLQDTVISSQSTISKDQSLMKQCLTQRDLQIGMSYGMIPNSPTKHRRTKVSATSPINLKQSHSQSHRNYF